MFDNLSLIRTDVSDANAAAVGLGVILPNPMEGIAIVHSYKR